jgi:hypothetical protein
VTGNLLRGMDEIVKLAHQYKEFVAGVPLNLKSLFMKSLHAKRGFINFKGWRPFK